MMASCPSSVPGDEFKEKRVLVTDGTKGMGEARPSRGLEVSNDA
jgi:hypothetical protein